VGFPFALPKRYRIDENGIAFYGLSIEETFEFETLDDQAPLEETGAHIAWHDSVPITNRESAGSNCTKSTMKRGENR
jgi:hypothetical protein